MIDIDEIERFLKSIDCEYTRQMKGGNAYLISNSLVYPDIFIYCLYQNPTKYNSGLISNVLQLKNTVTRPLHVVTINEYFTSVLQFKKKFHLVCPFCAIPNNAQQTLNNL